MVWEEKEKNSKLQATLVWEEKERKTQSYKQQWCKREKRIVVWEFLWEWKDLSFMRNNEQIVLSM